jgi:hypothetical protein
MDGICADHHVVNTEGLNMNGKRVGFQQTREQGNADNTYQGTADNQGTPD